MRSKADTEAMVQELANGRYDSVRRRSYIALDVPGKDAALGLVDLLGDAADGYKVGLELFYGAGPQMIEELAARNKRVFLDIKLHDIPTTVAHALRVVSEWPIEMVNVHSSGGLAMLQASRQAVDDSTYRPLLIGVTVLTSLSDSDLHRLGLADGDKLPVAWSRLCQEAGLDGVVTSAVDVSEISRQCGMSFVTVVPGTRPSFASLDDQNRVMTPGEAVKRGASRLVLGRAVTKADNPVWALAKIYDEMLAAQIETDGQVGGDVNE